MKLNNVPLRRIAQSFVIATKTKVDVSGVKLPENVNDHYFARRKTKKPKYQTGDNIFANTKEEYKVTEERKKDQATVDSAILSTLKKSKDGKALKGYLSTHFRLGNGQYPHNMVF